MSIIFRNNLKIFEYFSISYILSYCINYFEYLSILLLLIFSGHRFLLIMSYHFGNRIRDIRKRYGLQQNELEQLLGLKKSLLSTWERNPYPPLEGIVKVCEHFGITTGMFFDDSLDKTDLSEIEKSVLSLMKNNLTREEQDLLWGHFLGILNIIIKDKLQLKSRDQKLDIDKMLSFD
jgi:transcriptional regulator with XRE-family HTH domain